MRRMPPRRALCALVLMLSTTICADGAGAQGPDTPVSSDDAPATAPKPQQGVAGVVVTQTGQPVADVLVSAVSSGPRSGPVPDIAIYSGADGGFFWPLRPGVYRLEAMSREQRIGSTLVHVRRGNNYARIIVRF